MKRADRILDAAAELLVRLGYRKVTIEDIAQRAGVGKGTVYLHWRTKQQLFDALLLREAIAYLESLLAELRRDPATVLPHRLLSFSFVDVQARPVLRVLVTGDTRPIQGMPADRPLRSQELLATKRMFDLLVSHGLLRDDVPNLPYAMSALNSGFYLVEGLDPQAAELEVRAKADSLAFVVRHALEPPSPPGPEELAQAAAEIIAVFEDLIPPYRQWIYQG
ncbi:TetR/AcrR family transcriptional regulator [Nonomuraea africana]|uniref:AcrR family transcriptional regulator n=1 Tax=Nonomuraea africana TaxID=46171 RepID=A0ABR9KRG0_9ACTN|nr:helix-turn-helix domain-containing protein [Nonomuraea africana]MBE1564345.1 AcrR family transcriptional regulator [Nonomuraea africana]